MANKKTIALHTTYGGMYVGTVDQCLTFITNHNELMVSDSLGEYFHYSETKGQYVYIPDMHPTYIRNVLLKELKEYQEFEGYSYMEYLLTDKGQLDELVAEALRLWYEISGVEWDVHRDALLYALETSEVDVEDLPLP